MKIWSFVKENWKVGLLGVSGGAIAATLLPPTITFELPSIEDVVHFLSDNSVLIIGTLLLINILLVLKRLMNLERHVKWTNFAHEGIHESFENDLDICNRDIGALNDDFEDMKVQHKADYDLSKQAWDETQKAMTEVPNTYATLQSTAALGDRLIGMISNHSRLIAELDKVYDDLATSAKKKKKK
jgi:hypothetical protein